MHSLEQRRGKKLPGCHKKVSCRSKAANSGKSWREKKGFTGKSAYKQTVLYHYRDRITACLQRDSLSQIIHAYSAPFIFKPCPKTELGHFGCSLKFFPSVYYMFTSTEPEGYSQILGH